MADELKPCPFCGGNVVKKREGELVWIKCDDGSSCNGSSLAVCYLQENEVAAIAAWNRRAPADEIAALQARVTELEGENARLEVAIAEAATELEARISEIPKHTCAEINAVLRNIKPVAQAARGMDEPFADDVDALLRDLPDALEELRAANNALRDRVHEALDSRKSVAKALRAALKGNPNAHD